MSRYLVHRSDSNAEAVYEALKACGVHVERIGRPVDALLWMNGMSFVTFQLRLRACQVEVAVQQKGRKFLTTGNTQLGYAVLAEIKTPKGKTRSKAQAAFLARYPGPVLILRSAADPSRKALP